VKASVAVMETVMSNAKTLYVMSYHRSASNFLKYYIKSTTNINYKFIHPGNPLEAVPDNAVIIALARNPKDSVSSMVALENKETEFSGLVIKDIMYQLKYYLHCYNYFDKEIENIIRFEDIRDNTDKVVEFLCNLVGATKHTTIENAWESFDHYYRENPLEFSGTCVKITSKTDVLYEDIVNKLSTYDLSEFDNIYNIVEKKSIKF
jgi:hypothetical protein